MVWPIVGQLDEARTNKMCHLAEITKNKRPGRCHVS
ncbi:hypothetical protein PF003_g14190 [Phytophthora fragariae]|nr:hypothetical protein PF003_g14190 [Phytophthora fragariae]